MLQTILREASYTEMFGDIRFVVAIQRQVESYD